MRTRTLRFIRFFSIALSLLPVVSLPFHASGFEGIVKDAASKTPVPYVNIGIIGKNIGTVSDENGKFQIKTEGCDEGDTIRISMIGYESIAMRVSKFRSQCKIGDCEILLSPKKYELKEVVITPKKTVAKILGNTFNSKSMQAGFKENLLGHEIGVLMKVKKKDTRIISAGFNIASCKMDTIFYRMNIYKVENGVPTENLLPEPIYINIPKDKIAETITVDLKKYNLYVSHDYLISLEIVKDLGANNLYFSAGVLGAPLFYRYTSQASWEKFSGASVGIFSEVIMEK